MTLTQTAILTKQIIVITLLAFVVGTVSFIGYRIWYSYYLSTLPPPEEKPDTKFGVLPYPNFPKVSVSSSNFSYTLDTITGGLPVIGRDEGFEKLVKVYFVIKLYATFLSPDKNRTLAEKFGIVNPPEILNENTYKFTKDKQTLIIDLDSGNFKYSKEATSSSKVMEEDKNLISGFSQTLNLLGVLKEELKRGRSNVIPLKLDGNQFSLSDQRDQADAVLISIWPQNLDNKPIYTSFFDKSEINTTIISSSDNLENYISLNYSFYQIDTSTFATYLLKMSETAFNDLKSGKGIVIVEPKNPQVSITSVSLGYFLSENYSPYVQPIYVFEGPSFVAYVSAISSQFQKE